MIPDCVLITFIVALWIGAAIGYFVIARPSYREFQGYLRGMQQGYREGYHAGVDFDDRTPLLDFIAGNEPDAEEEEAPRRASEEAGKPAAPSLVEERVGPGPLVCRAWDWITGADENDPAFSLVLELAETLEDRERRLKRLEGALGELPLDWMADRIEGVGEPAWSGLGDAARHAAGLRMLARAVSEEEDHEDREGHETIDLMKALVKSLKEEEARRASEEGGQ